MLVPMLVVNENVDEFYFAGAASGGITAPAALIEVAARAILAKENLAYAVAARRVHGGSQRQAFVEPGLEDNVIQGLRRRGHTFATTSRLGNVNAVACAKGIPPHPESCAAESDPRGYGLAVRGQQ